MISDLDTIQSQNINIVNDSIKDYLDKEARDKMTT